MSVKNFSIFVIIMQEKRIKERFHSSMKRKQKFGLFRVDFFFFWLHDTASTAKLKPVLFIGLTVCGALHCPELFGTLGTRAKEIHV